MGRRRPEELLFSAAARQVVQSLAMHFVAKRVFRDKRK
jgi:hypothetical protein